MRKPRLLWMSDINCHSGFGTVAENVLKYLQAKYDIYTAGWNFDPRKKYKKPWKYYYLYKEPNKERGITFHMLMERLQILLSLMRILLIKNWQKTPYRKVNESKVQ